MTGNCYLYPLSLEANRETVIRQPTVENLVFGMYFIIKLSNYRIITLFF
jgi:hypothetical protein